MDLTGVADAVRRRWRIVSLIVLLSVGCALLISELQGKRYTSATRLVVSGSSAGVTGEAANLRLAMRRADLIARLATTDSARTAAEQAAAEAGHPDVGAAHVSVRASASRSAPLLTIAVTADDPDVAQAVANAYPLVLPGQLARVGQLPQISSGALFKIDSAAQRPGHASAPDPVRNILIGIAAGMLLGLAAVGLRESQWRRPARPATGGPGAAGGAHGRLARIGQHRRAAAPAPRGTGEHEDH